MKCLALDSEYRDRWIEFHLANGTVEDSRLKNWRNVAWDQVIRIVAHLNGNTHKVECTGSGFRAFMNFRWGGHEYVKNGNGRLVPRKISLWTIGWTDGRQCFLKDIDFHTGQHVKGYIAPLSQFMGHIHPLVRNRVLG